MKKIKIKRNTTPRTKTVYVVDAWIHPMEGGDDYIKTIQVLAYDREIAKNLTRQWLSKISDITDDFRIVRELRGDHNTKRFETEKKEERK